MGLDPSTFINLGSAGIFTVGCLVLKYGPPIKKQQGRSEVCEEHHHLAATVDDMKKSIAGLHLRLDDAAKALYLIEGYLEKTK